jgi:hypothetical protein
MDYSFAAVNGKRSPPRFSNVTATAHREALKLRPGACAKTPREAQFNTPELLQFRGGYWQKPLATS